MIGRKFTPPSSMLATLQQNRNAVLCFTLKTGAFIRNPETGNRTPEVTSSEFQAIVHSTRKPDDATEQFYEGKDKQVQWFRGRIVIPQLLPKVIKHLSRGTMKIGVFDDDNNFTEQRSGDLILYNPYLNPYVQGALGTEFFGVFLEK